MAQYYLYNHTLLMCAEFRDLIQRRTLQRILQQEHRRPGGFLCMHYYYAPVAMHSVVMCTVYVGYYVLVGTPICLDIADSAMFVFADLPVICITYFCTLCTMGPTPILVSCPAPFHARGEKGSGQMCIGPMSPRNV